MARTYSQLACALGLVLILSGTNRADLVVGYDAVDTGSVAGNLTPITEFPLDVIGSDLTRGPGLQSEAGPTGVEYNSSNWKTGSPGDAANSWNFSFTSTSLFELDSLIVRAARTAVGPMSLELQVDVGQTSVFTNLVGAAWVKTVNTTAEDHSFDLSSLAMTNNIAFRLLGYLASNSGTNAQMWIADDGNYNSGGTADVVLNGSVAVPEPGAVLFGGLVCGVLGSVSLGRRFGAKVVTKSAD